MTSCNYATNSSERLVGRLTDSVLRQELVITLMTDPMHALTSFQDALRNREITPRTGEVHKDLLVLVDQPGSSPRFTYALTESGRVVAVAIFVVADPISGAPCFNSGYAVDARCRSRGL